MLLNTPGPSCFLIHPASAPQLLSNHRGGWQHRWIQLLRLCYSHLEPEIPGGCDTSCLLIWQEIFSLHRYQLGTLSAGLDQLPVSGIHLGFIQFQSQMPAACRSRAGEGMFSGKGHVVHSLTLGLVVSVAATLSL